MTALAIEINDAGLVVADESGVLAVEPGVAYVDRGSIVTGSEALEHLRSKPRQVSSRFWSQLSMEPGSGIEGRNSSAELAFAHPCTGDPVLCVEPPPPLFRHSLDRE